MEYVTMNKSDLKVSRLCMGGCPMGGYGWGKVCDHELIDTVHMAMDNGVNFYDTADTYGLGKSEEILGEALKDRRGQAIIASKFGVHYDNGYTRYDNSVKWINHSICGSLKRLKTDYLDLYQIHYRDANTPLVEVVDALEKLKEKGLIRYYGLSNIYSKEIAEIKQSGGNFVSFQDEYSLASRKNEKDIIELYEKLGMTPMTWGSLGQGILTGKYTIDSRFEKDDRRSRDVYVNFHGNKLKKNLEIVEVIRNISKSNSKPIASIAIRFILDYIPGSIVLAGIKDAEQLYSNLKATDWHLTDFQKEELLNISNDY